MIQPDYSEIPTFDCRAGCSDCCGPHPWSKAEQDRIHAWLAQRGREPLKATGIECPYVEHGRCSIYETRPMICRLFGTVRALRCPHGCGPVQPLSPEAEKRLIDGWFAELGVTGRIP